MEYCHEKNTLSCAISKYICICMCAHRYIRTYVHTYTGVNTRVYCIHTYARTYIRMYHIAWHKLVIHILFAHQPPYTSTYVNTYIRYVHTHIRTVCTYVHTYVHTYTYVHMSVHCICRVNLIGHIE